MMDIQQFTVYVETLHRVIIEESGGLLGLRDRAMLESALARPFASFDGVDLYPDDFEKAAALFHSLIKNHPFVDGNKRIAFLTALYFLANQGYSIPHIFPQAKVVAFCVQVIQGEINTIADMTTWFRALLEETL